MPLLTVETSEAMALLMSADGVPAVTDAGELMAKYAWSSAANASSHRSLRCHLFRLRQVVSPGAIEDRPGLWRASAWRDRHAQTVAGTCHRAIQTT